MKSFIFVFILILFSEFSVADIADILKLIDIGSACKSGTYEKISRRHILTGEGKDIYDNSDEFSFACVKLNGDMEITAKVLSVEKLDDWTKAGVMIRENLLPGSKHIMLLFAPQNLISLQKRDIYEGLCERYEVFNIKVPCWVRISRSENTFIGQYSQDGNNWITVNSVVLDMPEMVYYGLAVTSHSACNLATAEFTDVSISKNTQVITNDLIIKQITTKFFYSQSVRDSFKIFISLPVSYLENKSQNYPVIYYLDGNGMTNHMIIREYADNGLIPEVISVSIGYPYKTMRDRDYTYNFMNFYNFLKDELIPYMDKNFRTDPLNRTLSGHSYGGLCGLFTLFQSFDYKYITFQNIISSSPSIWWTGIDLGCFEFEKKLHEITDILPVNLYMTMGSLEGTGMIPNFLDMSDILVKRKYKYFNIKSQLNEGYDHSTNSEKSFREGIIWILNQSIIPPSDIEREINGIPKIDNNEISVYPIPTGDMLHMVLINPKFNFELINFQGNTVTNQNVAGTNYELEVSNLPKGLYILKINSKSGLKTQKIIKQ